MILVVGGFGAGKRKFVQHVLGYEPQQMSDKLNGETPVLCNLQSLDPLPGIEELTKFEVVVCNEVGCGVIPLEAAERLHREAVGRLCCQLAREAQAVYRVTCGLGMRLK